MSAVKKNQSGEIVTLVTLGTFVVLGALSLFTSILIKNPQTTKTSAADLTDNSYCTYCQGQQCVFNSNYPNCTNPGLCTEAGKECNNNTVSGSAAATTSCSPGNCTNDETDCKNTKGVRSSDASKNAYCAQLGGSKSYGPLFCCEPADTSSTATKVCECSADGKTIVNKELCTDVNPCGPEMGSGCAYGQWKNDCTGSAENCPADAGVTYTSWCDKDGKWRFQYPNCVAWCKPAYLSQAPKPVDTCSGKSAGEIIEANTDISCDGTQGPKGEWVILNKFCDQFGQVQSGPGGSTGISCDKGSVAYQGKTFTKQPVTINNSTVAKGCFHLDVEGEQQPTDKGVNFNFKVKFVSDGGDGDIRLEKNGALVAGWNGWNLKTHGDVYTYSTQWTGSPVFVPKGGNATVTYKGVVANTKACPDVSSSTTCELSVDSDGLPWTTCNITNMPANAPKARPVVRWDKPAPIKITQTPIVFQNTSQNTIKSTSTSTVGPTSSVSTNTSAQLNRCPDGKGASCVFKSCGAGYTKIDLPCISFWDVCCVNDSSGPPELLTPVPKQIIEIEVEYQLSALPITQAVEIQKVKNKYICDYYGQSNFGTNDIRNCQPSIANSFTQTGDKARVKFSVNTVQKQMICTIVAKVPVDCIPVN